MNTQPLPTLASDFVRRILERNRIVLIPFCETRAFAGAYSTIQRTLRKPNYAPLSPDQKEGCEKLITSTFANIGNNNFDAEIERLILALAQENKISIGHAQKLVGMSAKYLFVLAHMEPSPLPPHWKKFVALHQDKLPIPIDRIVLRVLADKHPARAAGISVSGEADAFLRKQRWSRLTDYNQYWDLQKSIRDLAKDHSVTPMEFEMRELWM